jgi:uroporphyrinogen III methyltransferase / synthase
VFTSANAARFFWQRTQRPPKLAARVCAVGPATGAALAERGIPVHRVADEYIAEGVVQALGEEDLAGRNILLPCSSAARDVLPRELAARGANVVVVPVYRNVAPDDLAARAGEVFARKPHWITFLSPSAVNNVVAAAGVEALRDVKIASIGAITSEAVRGHGLVVAVEASPSTSDDLVREIAAFERPKAA